MFVFVAAEGNVPVDQRPRITDFSHDISAIDTHYLRPGLASSHLLVYEGRAAFVDTGANNAVPLLLAALEEKGLGRDQVDYVLLTHIHLDHAGGAGLLMEALPNAVAVIHPRGAAHMADPAKLEAGTRAVYGDEMFESLYGSLRPIEMDRIRTVADGEVLSLSGRELEFIHTEGHARHHYCIVDRFANAIFTGDTFGLSYRDLDTDKGEFIFPTTTPIHFDPEALHASIDRIMAYGPDALFLTHYSRVTDLERLAADLHTDIDVSCELARKSWGEDDRENRLTADLTSHLYQRMDQHGCNGDPAWRQEIVAADMSLNASGLMIWLDRLENRRGN
jgi:glyoxylase-like metal-dependent hydrolase (beta-lactamase superfamily II)